MPIIATFNVHGLSGNRIKRVAQEIQSIGIKIIFLQEISEKVTMILARLLKFNWSWANAEFLGNGLLSQYPIRKAQSIQMKSHRAETRSALKAIIETPQKNICVMGTHLDHIHEDTRLRQLKILEQYIHDVEYIMGDFNSLYLDDYSKEEIDEINRVRSLTSWPLAEGKVVERIKKLGFKVHNNNSSTSRFKTRIDFIFYKNRSPEPYYVLECISRHLSDHDMVVAFI